MKLHPNILKELSKPIPEELFLVIHYPDDTCCRFTIQNRTGFLTFTSERLAEEWIEQNTEKGEFDIAETDIDYVVDLAKEVAVPFVHIFNTPTNFYSLTVS